MRAVWGLLAFASLLLFASAQDGNLEFSQFAGPVHTGTVQEGENRLQSLLSKSSKKSLLYVNSGEFEDYVRNAPRPYSLIVMLTSKMQCDMCEELHPEMQLVADAFEKARYARSKDGKSLDSKPLHNVFVVALDASRNFQLFQAMGYQTIPHIIFVPATKNKNSKSWAKTLVDHLQPASKWTAEGIVKVLRSRIPDLNIEVDRPPQQVDYTSIVFTIVAASSALVFFMTVGRPIIDKYLSSPWLWLALSLVAYGFCISGQMYNHINKVQPFHQHQNGDIEYIHTGGHTQFAVESYIIAILYTLAAACIVAMNTGVFRFKLPPTVKLGVIVFCLFAFHFLFRLLRSIYTRKSPGYRMGFVWDASEAVGF